MPLGEPRESCFLHRVLEEDRAEDVGPGAHAGDVAMVRCRGEVPDEFLALLVVQVGERPCGDDGGHRTIVESGENSGEGLVGIRREYLRRIGLARRMDAAVRSSRPESGQTQASSQRTSSVFSRSIGARSMPIRDTMGGSRGAIGGRPPSTVHSILTGESAGPVAPNEPYSIR